jgi:hypothetical protein
MFIVFFTGTTCSDNLTEFNPPGVGFITISIAAWHYDTVGTIALDIRRGHNFRSLAPRALCCCGGCPGIVSLVVGAKSVVLVEDDAERTSALPSPSATLTSPSAELPSGGTDRRDGRAGADNAPEVDLVEPLAPTLPEGMVVSSNSTAGCVDDWSC